MTTDQQIKQREAEALQLLMDGYTRASVVRTLAKAHKVDPRTARRYVAAAQLDMFDAPMTRNDLEFGIMQKIERLELIADEAKDAGEKKLEITATKAAAAMAEARLKSLQRETEFLSKVGSASAPF